MGGLSKRHLLSNRKEVNLGVRVSRTQRIKPLGAGSGAPLYQMVQLEVEDIRSDSTYSQARLNCADKSDYFSLFRDVPNPSLISHPFTF